MACFVVPVAEAVATTLLLIKDPKGVLKAALLKQK
jgi:hypothetical protein